MAIVHVFEICHIILYMIFIYCLLQEMNWSPVPTELDESAANLFMHRHENTDRGISTIHSVTKHNLVLVSQVYSLLQSLCTCTPSCTGMFTLHRSN